MVTMLAVDVGLITKKFQHQSLEDGQPATNIKLINPDDGYKLSESTQATIAGNPAPGKKVWSVPLNAKTESTGAPVDGDFVAPVAPQDSGRFMCINKKPLHPRKTCDSETVSNSTTRPKKRHCRSMSVPQETEINIPPAKSTWQPQGSNLWKPVAVAAMGGRNCHLVNFPREASFTRTYTQTPTEFHLNEKFASLAPNIQRHIGSGHITPEDFLTPPESPVPRPSSAVYSDGAVSPLGAPWLDFNNQQMCNKYDAFRNRSLSLEDKISCNSCASMCVTSFSSVPFSINTIPTSPHHRHRIPRCRSQPTFYDRKCGRRRRRDSRPNLNFLKMTETAYGNPGRCDPFPTPNREQRHSSQFHDELENVMSLMPIASSPQDSEIPLRNFSTEKVDSPDSRSEEPSTSEQPTEEEHSPGPVKLLGEDDETEMEMFQLTEELDLEQIENH